MIKNELIQLATEAKEKSYSPYSNFRVGAALLSKDGKVYQGANIENAAYGATICAERTAAFAAKLDGVEEFSAIGIHSYQSLYYFYKWANFKLDESFYETFSDYDEDEMPRYKLVFIDDRFRDYKLPIIPYHNNGEVAYYRLNMTLNEYGFSIIEFMDYLSGNKQLELNFKCSKFLSNTTS